MKAITAAIITTIRLQGHAHHQNSIFLALVNFSSQTAVSDGIDDDWLVGLRTRLLEEFRTFSKQNMKRLISYNTSMPTAKEAIKGSMRHFEGEIQSDLNYGRKCLIILAHWDLFQLRVFENDGNCRRFFPRDIWAYTNMQRNTDAALVFLLHFYSPLYSTEVMEEAIEPLSQSLSMFLLDALLSTGNESMEQTDPALEDNPS